ncbi:MAG: hypothetical protein LOD94_05645 [Gammaproteobacteria bacterium]
MDASEQRLPLQIVEDVTFQQRTWKVERVGWIVIAAIVIAALCGLFGGGWLGRAAVRAGDGSLSLEYDRLWRVRSPASLEVDVKSSGLDEEGVRVWIARDYIGSMSSTEITPQPVRVEGDAERVVFEFATTDEASAIGIVFRVEPQRAWRLQGALGLDGGYELHFSQFIFP